MEYLENKETRELTFREQEVMSIYKKRNAANKHKVDPIPVCEIPKEYLK
jgi:NAD+ synthase